MIRNTRYSNYRTKRAATSSLVKRALAALLVSLSSFNAFALEEKTFCVWDPVGRTGPVMTFYSDVIPKAQAWGLKLRFQAYTEETDVVKHFKAGRCEAAVLTSILSRQFVKFAGTMDAIGAINSQKGLELAIATLTRSRAGKLMIEDNYEVVTTFPVGSMYAFVKDRTVDTIDEFAGKKLAILNEDPQMYKFAALARAFPVNVTLSNFADKFRTGEVDIVIMPALAYNTFELYEGLGKKGGIIDYRLYYGMLQTIARRDQFPEDFGSKMRNYMLTRMNAMNKMVVDAEEEIPRHYWVQTNQFVKDDIDHFSKRVRLALQEDNVNNSTALKLFWKIRCRLDSSRGECKNPPSFSVAKNKSENKSTTKQVSAQSVRKAEEKRVAAERVKEQEAEAKRLAEQKRLIEEQKQKAEAEKLAEQQRLAKERQQIEEQRRQLERLKQEELRRAEEKRLVEQQLAAEKKRIEEARQALERERQALEQVKRQKQALAQEQVAAEPHEEESTDEAEAPSIEQASLQQDGKKRWSLWNFLFGWI